MAKIYGIIGYGETNETKPGVYDESITEKMYRFELLRAGRRLENSGNVNDNIKVLNEISIVADPFAYNNFGSMRYAKFRGTKWKISNVEVQYPRLILTLGGVYNA